MWIQKPIKIAPKSRGFHLITHEIEQAIPEMADVETGLLHLLIQHTSASLCVNENADPSVRRDMESYFLRSVPENASNFEHTLEGPDDMPAHIKSAILGCELTLPISHGRLNLGTWQGIYLGEHRNHGGSRRILATLNGMMADS